MHICFTDKDESKSITIDKCSTKEDESECIQKTINRQKDTNNEAEYEGSSVIDEVPIYSNISECGRNILNRLDVKYE